MPFKRYVCEFLYPAFDIFTFVTIYNQSCDRLVPINHFCDEAACQIEDVAAVDNWSVGNGRWVVSLDSLRRSGRAGYTSGEPGGRTG